MRRLKRMKSETASSTRCKIKMDRWKEGFVFTKRLQEEVAKLGRSYFDLQVEDQLRLVENLLQIKQNGYSRDSHVKKFVDMVAGGGHRPDFWTLLRELLDEVERQGGQFQQVIASVNDWWLDSSGNEPTTLDPTLQKQWSLLSKIKAVGGNWEHVYAFLHVFFDVPESSYRQIRQELAIQLEQNSYVQKQWDALIDAVFKTRIPDGEILRLAEVCQAVSEEKGKLPHEFAQDVFDALVYGIICLKKDFRRCKLPWCCLPKHPRSTPHQPADLSPPDRKAALRKKLLPPPMPEGVRAEDWAEEPLKGTWAYWNRKGKEGADGNAGPSTWGPPPQKPGQPSQKFGPEWTKNILTFRALIRGIPDIFGLQLRCRHLNQSDSGTWDELVGRIVGTLQKPERGATPGTFISSRMLKNPKTGKGRAVFVLTHNEIWVHIVEFCIGSYPECLRLRDRNSSS